MVKKTIEIRTRLTVEVGSDEEMLWEYLKNKQATPYKFHEMLAMAVETYWLPLAYQYKKQPAEMVSQVLMNGAYRWQLHDSYLHKRTRIPGSFMDIAGHPNPPQTICEVTPTSGVLALEATHTAAKPPSQRGCPVMSVENVTPDKFLEYRVPSELPIEELAENAVTVHPQDKETMVPTDFSESRVVASSLKKKAENEMAEEKFVASKPFNPFGESIVSK